MGTAKVTAKATSIPAPEFRLSSSEARRVVLSAQGLAKSPGNKRTGVPQVRQVAHRLLAIQIDSVNVLVRSHYMPAFSRLGPYPAAALDALVHKRRELFEYWGHAASLLPIELQPLLRWRMERHNLSDWGSRDRKYVEAILKEVTDRGPMSAGELKDPGKRKGPWWGWAEGKRAMEWLFASGHLAIAGRRGFERLYDLTERVLPSEILDAPTPTPDDARKELLTRAARALGVATAKDVATYFFLDFYGERPKVDGKHAPLTVGKLLDELVEDGRLKAVSVEGWKKPALMDPAAKPPRSVDARALLTPFDSLVWERERTLRLFDFNYRIEIYVPAPKRQYGYYVLPFLLGDSLVGRVDLKAERKRKALLVKGSFAEVGADKALVASELATELRRMAEWLALESIEVSKRGDLSRLLSKAT